jgi:hypothetical protein
VWLAGVIVMTIIIMMMMMMMMMMIIIIIINSYIGHSTHTAGSANVEAQRSLIVNTALYAPLTVRAE